jgi:hypothetical protein
MALPAKVALIVGAITLADTIIAVVSIINEVTSRDPQVVLRQIEDIPRIEGIDKAVLQDTYERLRKIWQRSQIGRLNLDDRVVLCEIAVESLASAFALMVDGMAEGLKP